MVNRNCGVRVVLEQMSEIDRKALQSLLNAPVSAASVERELLAANYTVSYQTIYRHRTQNCSCGKKNERV